MPRFDAAWRAHAGRRSDDERVCDDTAGAQRCLTLRAGDGQGDVVWRVQLDPPALQLDYSAAPGVLHFLRLADATLIPLPPEHPPARHFLVPGRAPARPLQFAPGDAYLALSPGAARLADSPALARFIHLRDYFNAEKMAQALLDQLSALAGAEGFPEDVTVLVVEAR
jgi:hypothetical protein